MDCVPGTPKEQTSFLSEGGEEATALQELADRAKHLLSVLEKKATDASSKWKPTTLNPLDDVKQMLKHIDDEKSVFVCPKR